jgi:hypothetical protein
MQREAKGLASKGSANKTPLAEAAEAMRNVNRQRTHRPMPHRERRGRLRACFL